MLQSHNTIASHISTNQPTRIRTLYIYIYSCGSLLMSFRRLLLIVVFNVCFFVCFINFLNLKRL